MSGRAAHTQDEGAGLFSARGRGTTANPPNRFERLSLEVLDEHVEEIAREAETLPDGRTVRTQVLRDGSRSALNRVDSPDVGLQWTVNPYRGCEHGCVYCFARPGHEMLGLSSGLDFETKIFAKPDAPSILRKELSRPSWAGEPVVLSGVTDPYQPVERRLRITRGCLELFASCRQPVRLISKSRTVLRDLDLLQPLAEQGAAAAAISVTTLDPKLSGTLEPRAASPADRLHVIRELSRAGVPVTTMVAPVIPALNDREIPAILEAAAEAGAASAGYVLLRLPHQLKEVFDEWLDREFPHRRDHVQNLLRSAREGKLYDAKWGERLRGTGPYAKQIGQTFHAFAKRHGLDQTLPPLSGESFRRPGETNQLSLFGA